MNEQVVRIRGIDPLLFRDGRPFGAEVGSLFAQTLRVPYPSTVAGFLRTLAGNRWGVDWGDSAAIQHVLSIRIRGPLLERNGELVFRAPADALLTARDGKGITLTTLRPAVPPQGAGCDLPEGVLPLLPQREVTGKPPTGYHFWRGEVLSQWLADPTGDNTPLPDRIPGMEVEERVHVAIEDEKGTSREELLFTVQFLSFERYRWEETPSWEEWSLLVQIFTGQPVSRQGVGLLGGEKRLASVEVVEGSHWFACPANLHNALRSANRVRMLLATPAVFRDGWKPSWLGADLAGSPPSAPQLRLRLVAAAVPRREAVSGWDYREGHRGPKPVRWLAPAGSVYFFEVLDGDPTVLAKEAWLQSVCDEEQDQRDGFGLALWGIW